ncbi:response regulator transcription factor [Effusibacillus lacus]|uniref:DNA-binding response regulator n=1 Tax=Effusibacillus lacus TaxID=1348429 RepID=A0A292YPN8_9BACL|nr:response regulator transcription factor [Effusibacillus lacus]TCS76528.1 two-component system response regulator ResD [Effusibacillus lacus]GAX90450.1 DNA-binding response regulator [Effusibacillus lacus]
MLHTKVLLADDDRNVREIIRLYFNKQQIELLEADNGYAALEIARNDSPHVVILDVMMPGMDGFEVCKEIRKESDVPIIMLTAKEEEFDRVLGLELGADDYMTKPFSPRELVARMKAIFRRLHPREVEETSTCLSFKDLKIDRTRREVTVKGEIISFRPKEFDLLVQMAKSPGSVFTREQLLEQIWGYSFFGDIRTVDVHIKKIRQRLSNLDYDPVQTVWGVGYKFEAQP